MTDTTRVKPEAGIPDTPLPIDEVHRQLDTIPDWGYHQVNDKAHLKKGVMFDSRAKALDFVKRLHVIEETLEHDAEKKRCYKRVTMRLTTFHQNERLTARDFELARCIDEILETRKP